MIRYPLSDESLFLWGAVGGLVAFLLVFVLPELKKGWAGGAPRLTLGRVLIALGIGASLVALAGAAAWIVGDATTSRQAVAYGMACEATLGGILKGAAGT